MALFFLIALVAKEMRASAISSALRLACRSPPQRARMIDELGIAAEAPEKGSGSSFGIFETGGAAALP